jgi:hypothetical protein
LAKDYFQGFKHGSSVRVGSFQFSDLPPGRYTLLVLFPEYESEEHLVTVSGNSAGKILYIFILPCRTLKKRGGRHLIAGLLSQTSRSASYQDESIIKPR